MSQQVAFLAFYVPFLEASLLAAFVEATHLCLYGIFFAGLGLTWKDRANTGGVCHP